MEKFILALDQGTTSSRAILFDKSGNQVALAQKEFTQYYPQPGWVEHDPEEIWSTQFEVARQALANAGLGADAIEAIGITNQRETTLIWDRKTGKPVYNAIVWQDRRTAEWCDRLKARAGEVIQKKTGLIVDAYFSASKIKWILDEVPGLRSRAEAGELAFGTVDAWLLWKLTDGNVHATDITNASRTMLFDIRQLKWDEGLLELVDIPASLLPQVKSSSETFGNTQCLGGSIPVTGIAGDQQSALFGQMCSEKGMVKNTYGTGCFMLMNIGDQPLLSNHNLVTTVAWQLNGKVTYAFEGSIFIAGAVVQWLRDGLGIIKSAGEIEALAGSVPDNGGVYLVPAFAGLGAPHWNQHARGTMLGITRGTSAAHIARAALESIALQTLDVLKAMEADAGEPVKELRVDGGATANNLLLQIQADVLGANVLRPRITETTAIGAAYLAGLATGYWKDVDEIRQQWQVDHAFSPGEVPAKSLVRNWNRAVRAAMSWANDNQ